MLFTCDTHNVTMWELAVGVTEWGTYGNFCPIFATFLQICSYSRIVHVIDLNWETEPTAPTCSISDEHCSTGYPNRDRPRLGFWPFCKLTNRHWKPVWDARRPQMAVHMTRTNISELPHTPIWSEKQAILCKGKKTKPKQVGCRPSVLCENTWQSSLQTSLSKYHCQKPSRCKEVTQTHRALSYLLTIRKGSQE